MKDRSENERLSRLMKFNFKKSKKSYLCGGEMVSPKRDRRRGVPIAIGSGGLEF